MTQKQKNGHPDTENQALESDQALAQEYLTLRRAGLVVEKIMLADLHADLLVRDRSTVADADLTDLMVSLRDIGLSNPVRVRRRAVGGGYELIQGHRRVEAYRALLAETGDLQWEAIPALVMPGLTGTDILYRQMIDENIVRKELSFAEMAEAARNFAADPTTDAQNVSEAIPVLFQSANYAKRSYIRAFARLLDQVGTILKFPSSIPRTLGLDLLKQLDAQPTLKQQIKAAFSNWDNRSIADELGVLREMAMMPLLNDPAPELIEHKAMPPQTQPYDGQIFDIRLPQGSVKCTATPGRLEIRADRNFARLKKDALKKVLSSLLDDDQSSGPASRS